LCQTAAISALELVLPSRFIPSYQLSCSNRRGRLSERRLLTPEVGLFEVALTEPMAYKAGQFVLLSGFGVRAPRAYSMTHYEPEKARLRFLVRRSPGGAFTNALFEQDIDDDLEIFGPLGRATFDCGEKRSFVAVAGGSGIAGMMSIVRHALEEGHFSDHPSHLFFGLREAGSSYLLDDLAAFVERSARQLRVTIAFSDAPCSEQFAARYPLLDFQHGLVHEIMRERMLASDQLELERMQRSAFFVGGPPLMVNATMRSLISDCKISPTEIRYDRFG
jgi:toluene monooxygenase electron transfer component